MINENNPSLQKGELEGSIRLILGVGWVLRISTDAAGNVSDMVPVPLRPLVNIMEGTKAARTIH